MKLEPTIEKNLNGSWVVSDIIGGYWVTKVYYGYTKRESLRLFEEQTSETLR